jgi:hypothetical protein
MMRDANGYMDDIFKFYAFSEQVSYKILSIPSYGLEDMNLARFKHLQHFSAKQRNCGMLFSPGGI